MSRSIINVMIRLLFVGVLSLFGCGGGGGGGDSAAPAVPASVDVTGTWAGRYNSSVFGSETATLNLQQSGNSISGTFSSTTGGLGSISGAVSGDTASFVITVTTPGCSGSFSGTGIVNVPQVGSPSMSFSYSGAASATCGGQESGTGNLTKQVPASVDVTGVWEGPYNSSYYGLQTGTLVLKQSGNSISGTFSVTASGGFSLHSIYGKVSSNTVSFNTNAVCSGTGIVNEPQVGSPTMSFNYNVTNSAACGEEDSGTGNLTKQ